MKREPSKAQEAYKQSIEEEIEHYTSLYQNEESLKTLTEKVPPSWFFVEEKFNDLICKANKGRSFLDEIAAHMQAHPGGRTLSIGSGPGALEMEVAQKLAEVGVEYEIICMDINPNVLSLGQERAKAQGLNMKFIVQDINELSLEVNQYDVIMCHASLHHLINLEHIYYEMNRSLKDDGEVVVIDVVTRNGYLMWKETYAVVQNLWRVLPDKFKYNHTAYDQVLLDPDFENRDHTGNTMECIRSGDVLPLLNEYFVCQLYVPFTSISRRFLDSRYGPNYDLSQELDRSIMEFIWQMDVYYLSQNILKPETMFGIYTKGVEKQRPLKYLDVDSRVVMKTKFHKMFKKVIHYLQKTFQVTRRDGIRATLHVIKDKVRAWFYHTPRKLTVQEWLSYYQPRREMPRKSVKDKDLARWPKVSILILTYNNFLINQLCLRSIYCNTTYPNFEVIVVDNASADETPNWLITFAETHPNLRLALNTDNRGFAGGNNQAAHLATGEYLIFLNNDTVVTTGWVEHLLAHMRSDPKIGLVGPVTNSTGNEARISISYRSPAEMETFAVRRARSLAGQAFDIRMLAFYCVMARKDQYEALGGLDERFKVGMFEDDDLAVRYHQQGYRVVCAEDVFIHHFQGASFGKLGNEAYQKVFDENRKKYEEKWGRTWEPYQLRKDV